MTLSLHILLYFYGTFLILCGIVSVIFIGPKAKTALMSGGMSGIINIFVGYLVAAGTAMAPMAGVVVSLALFIVFSWRSTKTLHKIFELIPSSHPDLNGKGIAFLIISLMAVVSIVVFMLQTVNALYPYLM
jgi:uncharacterized membrane protein (UPF0136 family)